MKKFFEFMDKPRFKFEEAIGVICVFILTIVLLASCTSGGSSGHRQLSNTCMYKVKNLVYNPHSDAIVGEMPGLHVQRLHDSYKPGDTVVTKLGEDYILVVDYAYSNPNPSIIHNTIIKATTDDRGLISVVMSNGYDTMAYDYLTPGQLDSLLRE